MKPYKIDNSICTACGSCIEACHTGAVVKDGDVYRINENDCIACGHCQAVCPVNAVMAPAEETLADVGFMENEMGRLLATRRSVRTFKDKRIPSDVINKLIDAASYAPAAVNCRDIEYIVVTDAGILEDIKKFTADFYEMLIGNLDNEAFLNQLKSQAPEKFALIGNESLVNKVQLLAESLRAGIDMLFYDAPCLILLHTKKGSILPRENCCYALYNMVLLAYSMGIGSCINGLITSPANFHPGLRKLLKLPETHTIHTASVFGYPDGEYPKIPARERGKITWL